MDDPEFEAALAIVMRKIANKPTLLNHLSHDILRKLILYVGNLHTININNIDYPVDKLKVALTAAIADRSDGRWTYPGMRLLVCSYCTRVQCILPGEYSRLHHCMCKDCPNMFCGRYEDCPGAGNQTCARCVLYVGETRKCDACSK